MGAMMERQVMTITIQIEGHPQHNQEFFEDLSRKIDEIESKVFFRGMFAHREDLD